jgi:beta-glucosidase
MKTRFWQRALFVLGVLLISRGLLRADATTAPAGTNDGPADVAAAKVGMGANQFMERHEKFLARKTQGPIDVVFLGDSITQGWEGPGKDVWDKFYGDRNAANFGIGGDRTQHVLWRIDNGELDGISPKVLVLLIGTNNIGYSAEDILKGDTKIIDEIHEKLPNTKLLLLAIFPRGDDPSKPEVKAMRDKLATVNKGLAALDDGNKTRYLDIGDKFLDADGKIPVDIMKDALHPTAQGYEIWAEAMNPLLTEMMK